MNYEYEAKPSGVFSSTLECRWFVWFLQRSKTTQYVGHVDRWRDFLWCGESIEIKPRFEHTSVSEIASEVWGRVPFNVSELTLVIGSPGEFDVMSLARDRNSFKEIYRGSLLDGVS